MALNPPKIRAMALLLMLTLAAETARADFVDWWLTPDQQGRLAYQHGEYARAAQLFTVPRWKALAFYASGDFASAAAYFAELDSAFDAFYQGNAHAHLGELGAAIEAYERALSQDPDLEAARFNLDWVSGLAALDDRAYEDVGGTGGKLGADDFVFDDRAKNAQSSMTVEEAGSQGLTDAQIEEIWMRRVQTTPAEFLELKFAYQLQRSTEAP